MDYHSDYYPDYDEDKSISNRSSSPKRSTPVLWLVFAVVIFLLFIIFFFATSSSPNISFRVETSTASTSRIKPGGKFFSQLALALKDAGEIIGAVYDPETSRIIIVGNKNPKIPPLHLEDLAVAIQTVFSDTLAPPAASIDPDPINPLADSMFVKFFGNIENTHFGWVMFEADRKLKALSLGKDNITNELQTSRVKDYYNILQLSFSNLAGKYRKELWSRFWLFPARFTASVSEDWHSIYFEEARIGVRTETMRWQGNQLVSAGGAKDQKAEYFANHFSHYYDDFAKEEPVFAELRRLGKLLVIAQWLKTVMIPFDPYWVEYYGGRNFDIPKSTPSLSVEKQDSRKKIKIFGGTDLYIESRWIKDQGKAAQLQREILEKIPGDKSKPDFVHNFNEQPVHAFILPGIHHRIEQSEIRQVTDLSVSIQSNRTLELNRFFHPTHSEILEFGRGWTFNYPRLYSFNPNEKKKNKKGVISQRKDLTGIQDQPNSMFEKRVFYLYDAFGKMSATFNQSTIDQEKGQLFYICNDNSEIVGLYPQKSGNYEIRFNSGKKLSFNKNSSKLQSEIDEFGDEYYFEYLDDKLVQVTKNNQESIRFEYEDNSIVLAMASNGQHKKYEYNEQQEMIEKGLEQLEFQLNGNGLIHSNLSVEINPAAIVLKIPAGFELSARSSHLLKSFFTKRKEKFVENLKYSQSGNFILQVHDFGNTGYAIQTGENIFISEENVSDLKFELEQYWDNPAIVGDLLINIFGEGATKIPDQIILNSSDHEVDLLIAHYLTACGRDVLIDDLLKTALMNIQRQTEMDKSNPALIIDQTSFETSPDKEILKEGSDEIIELFKNNNLSEISEDIFEIPDGSNLVVITAENEHQLRKKIVQLGPELKGKHVILMSCGDIEQRMALPYAAHQIIEKNDCIGVTGFEQKIEIHAVKAVLEKYIEISSDNPDKLFQHLIKQSVEAAQKDPKNAGLIEEILKLEKMWDIISIKFGDDLLKIPLSGKMIKRWA